MEVHPTGSEGRRMDGCSTLIIGNNIYCNLIQQYSLDTGSEEAVPWKFNQSWNLIISYFIIHHIAICTISYLW